MKRNRPRVEDYTIGWISALPLEYSAAQVLLDEEHESIAEVAQHTLGRIGAHNVVQACLPDGQYGTTSAAVTAAELRSKFPSILYWLIVGIGGGVPTSGTDVRLGDVVVCKPQNQHGGVIQYDLGKTGPDGKHTRTGLLNAPPMALGMAVSKMQSIHNVGRSKIQSYLSDFSHLPRYQRGSLESDVLFESDYQHNNEPSCARCLPERTISRPQRPNQDPVVHFGLIASGNQVIKDAATRDALSAELGGVLCFEMEAAGLVNNFPCLVIRGICDYADSHKSKDWQHFAAASAAACAKEALSCIPCSPHSSQGVSEIPLYSQSLRELTVSQGSLAEISPVISQEVPMSSANPGGNPNFVDVPLSEDQRKQYLDSLRFSNINVRHATIRTAHAKTCRWILRRTAYLDWLNDECLQQHRGFFWIKGKPGAGKSTLMKFILANTSKTSSRSLTLSFFFNARGDYLEKSTLGMYQSILYQLLEKLPRLQDVLTLHPPQQNETGSFSWQIDNLKVAFEHAILQLRDRPLLLFIDALDECDEHEIRDMVSFFEYLGDVAVADGLNFRVCFSSRHYPHVTIDNCIELVLEEQDEHEQDIEQFLRTELKTKQNKFGDDIRSEISQRSLGIFLWVVLVVRILNTELARGNTHTMKKRLEEIPDGLERLFEDILTRDSHNTEQLVLCLQWVLFSQRLLKIEELYCGILSATDPGAVVPWNSDEIDLDDMRKFVLTTSKGLVEETKTKDKSVQFIHESVRDYFLKGGKLDTRLFGPFETFEARSHDMLKSCCFNYYSEVSRIKKAFAEKMSATKQFQRSKRNQHASVSFFKDDIFAYAYVYPMHTPGELSKMRAQGCSRLPFIDYAVKYVWDHCDKSHGLGIPQDSFIQNFSLAHWVPLNNALEISVRRQLSIEVDLLYVFAKKGLPSLIEHELSQDRSIDIRGEGYGFPLLAAARGAKRERATRNLLTYHLRNRTDISSQEVDRIVAVLLKDRTPLLQSDLSMLHWAARVPDIGLWRALLPNGTVTDSVVRNCGERLFTNACKFGFTDMVELFLSYGVDIDSRDQSGRPALLLASQNNQVEVVKSLLEHSVDVNSAYVDETPLMAASAAGHIGVVKLLLAHGADCDLPPKGQSSVRIAVQEDHIEILKLFLAQPGNRLDPALNAAIEYGQIDIVQFLLRQLKGSENLDLLYRGLSQSVNSPPEHRVEMAKLLLSRIPDTSSLGRHGYSAIKGAAKTPEILKMLLERGVNINSTDDDGETALLNRVRVGSYAEVKILLEFDADLELCDRKDTTPLAAAWMRGNERICELIEGYVE